MGMSGCVGMGSFRPTTCRCTGCPRPPTEVVVHAKPTKMKMLKKIKKKIGLGRASCVGGGLSSGSLTAGGSGNHLPPLTFHSSHGDNVRLSRDCSIARRVESFCKGIAFSARPVAVNEKVCVRFTEMSTNWSGVLRFGFTAHDPSTLAGGLPKYACPDLTNKPGHWAKALAERLCVRGSLLQYHVTSGGDVHFSVDGDDKGLFFCGVDTKGPLWALLDIYGNCTGVQFVDSRAHLNNSTRLSQQQQNHQQSEHASAEEHINTQQQDLDNMVDRSLVPAMRSASITSTGSGTDPTGWRPAHFHRMCGRHVRLGPEPGFASRLASEFCQGYVFTARPLAPGERLLVRVLETESVYAGALAIGLTSCDPGQLTPSDLPDDSDGLLDRPEYWVVSKDVAGSLGVGEELVLSVSGNGEVKVSLNGAAPVTVMYVDHSLRLWAFLDVYGGTRKVQVLSRPPPAVLVVALPPAHNAANHLLANAQSTALMQSTRSIHSSSTSSSSSTASIPVQLAGIPLSPPPQAVQQRSFAPQQNGVNHHQSNSINAVNNQVIPRTASAGLLHHQNSQNHSAISNNAQNCQLSSSSISVQNNQNNASSNQQLASHAVQASQLSVQSGQVQPSQSHHQPSHISSVFTHCTIPQSSLTATGECTICYEQQIDSVLYTCGHMCMCYGCAVQQWRGKGGGQCPMCRAPIRDVIRTYKS